MKEPPAETELRWSELKRAADFFDLLSEGAAIEAHLGKLEEGDRRKVVGLARWFISARAEERERCAKIAEADAPEFYDRTCHRIAARIRGGQ